MRFFDPTGIRPSRTYWVRNLAPWGTPGQEFLATEVLVPAHDEALVPSHVGNFDFQTLPFRLNWWQKLKLWLGCELFVRAKI